MKSNTGILLVCIIFFLLGTLSINEIMMYSPDCARYLIWANSLAKFEGFKDSSTPEPTRYVVHAPLYSVILAPFAMIFPNNVIAAKFATLIFGCLLLLFFYIWLKNRVSKNFALLGTIILAINPLMFMYSTQVLSDIPFALCVILIFYYSGTVVKNQHISRPDYLFALLVASAVLLREIGLALVISSSLLFLVLKKYWKALMIFGVTMVFYLPWFIRNELVIAKAEGALFRNSILYFSHIYTVSETSMLGEFLKRFLVNSIAYLKYLGRTIFLPDFQWGMSVYVFSKDPLVWFLVSVLPVLKYIVVILSLAIIAIGVKQEIKKTKKTKLIYLYVLFLVCYLFPVLFYPVISVRFLFPIMILALYFFIVGIFEIEKWLRFKIGNVTRKLIISVVILSLIFPNVIWMQNFIYLSYQYAKDPTALYEKFRKADSYPELFVKPLHLVARWIAENSDSNATVYSYWKELYFWLNGKKVIFGSPLSSWESVDYQLRDYDVKYLVATRWLYALNECEPILANSKKFDFELKHTIGSVQIYEVKQKRSKFSELLTGRDSLDIIYNCALRTLETNPAEAKRLFAELRSKGVSSAFVYLNQAVAYEFMGRIDSAKCALDKLEFFQQGGLFVRKAWFHKEIIYWLEKALKANSDLEKAMLLSNVARKYWDIGFRIQAMKMIEQALVNEPQFYPALISASLYSLQMGDTVGARNFLGKAKILGPSDDVVNSLDLALKYMDSLRNVSSRIAAKNFRLRIIENYVKANLIDLAIDDLKEMLEVEPFDVGLLNLLGELFESKSCFLPALKCYEKILINEPNNTQVREKFKLVKAKLE